MHDVRRCCRRTSKMAFSAVPSKKKWRHRLGLARNDFQATKTTRNRRRRYCYCHYCRYCRRHRHRCRRRRFNLHKRRDRDDRWRNDVTVTWWHVPVTSLYAGHCVIVVTWTLNAGSNEVQRKGQTDRRTDGRTDDDIAEWNYRTESKQLSSHDASCHWLRYAAEHHASYASSVFHIEVRRLVFNSDLERKRISLTWKAETVWFL